MTDLITDRSIRFIEQSANRSFFIDVSYNAPHWPYQPPDQPSTARDNGRHIGPFDEPTNTRGEYVAMLERVDQGVGRILETLDKLGLRENTIVIFTNDNGGEWLSRGAPLSHHKGTVWEGGIRVPAILRWPGRIPAGSVSSQVGITMDLTATVLAATRASLPQESALEGIDLMPILEGRAPKSIGPCSGAWRAWPRPQRAVRSGDKKLLLDGGRAMLFDLRADIAERDNLIGQQSDVARRLLGLLTAWEDAVGAEAKRTMAR